MDVLELINKMGATQKISINMDIARDAIVFTLDTDKDRATFRKQLAISRCELVHLTVEAREWAINALIESLFTEGS